MRVQNPEFKKVILEMRVNELETDKGILETWVQKRRGNIFFIKLIILDTDVAIIWTLFDNVMLCIQYAPS